MKLQNKSKHSYVHSFLDEKHKLVIIELKPNEIKEIPDDIAKKWLVSNEVVEYVAPIEAKNLKNENEILKKELEKLKTEKVEKAEKTEKAEKAEKPANKSKKAKI